MGLDLNNDYDSVKSKIKAYQTTVESKKDFLTSIKNNSGDNFEQAKKSHFSNLNEWGQTIDGVNADRKKQLQESAKTQLDQLTEIFMVSSSVGGNSKSLDKLFDVYNQTILNTRDRIKEMFIKEIIKAAGCSEEQQFTTSPLYIKVQSIDLYKKLYEDPNSATGSLLYEKDDTLNGGFPYAMNRQLYSRLQNKGFSFSQEYGSDYIGASVNPIMDLEYVDQDDNGNFGDYIKVTPKNKNLSVGSITQFLYDYYSSINLLDIDELITILMDNLTKAVTMDLNVDINFDREQLKIEKLLQRILGLCFDNGKEIDVSGIAKLSVLDNIDESFFELTSNDLRTIENELDNIQKGVTEFTDCDNVKLPVNTEAIIEQIKNIRDEDNDTKKMEAFKGAIDSLADNEEWKSIIPNININGSMKFDLLGIIPKGIMQALLSPKNVLGIMVVFKAVQNFIVDQIETLEDFFNEFKDLVIEVMSKIGAIFVEELFKEIEKNLTILVRLIIEEIATESKENYSKMIFTIINYAILVADGLKDWRQCKNVVDDLLKLLQFTGNILGIGLPAFSLSLARLLPGQSQTRAFSNYIEELQKAGIPTGDLPDGSPNLMLQGALSMIEGQHKEMVENGKVEVAIDPLSVVGGATTGVVKAYGKSY